LEHPQEERKVTITYFVPDERKAGGSYPSIKGILHKINEYERMLIMKDGMMIPIDRIKDIS
jgi:hypothetical protein